MAVMSLVLPSNVVFASNGAELRGTSPSGYFSNNGSKFTPKWSILTGYRNNRTNVVDKTES